ncbi:TRAP transporter small permease [Proteiniclasticum sp. SCR006]|uniref:TRAP transporter small permease n=1 Tax=Proteiniclasticum aestuarii TaxID=2817862 RepID=A0A939KJI8_9CLOT|nr:TRAP transporter small permease [Proteiniclasticum aestuarii]MBO1265198.1 TRAP transporter small permease [Proteiniclasticum aestuarii]
MKNKDIIETILKIGTLASFVGLIVTVLLQVITRFFIPGITLVWTEEGSRFLFKFAVAFGAPLAMKHNEYVNVDIVLNMMKGKSKDVLNVIIQIMSIGLFAVVLKESWTFVKIGHAQMSPTLGIPMSVSHAAITVASLFIILYGVVNLYKTFTGFRKGGEVK